MNTLLAEVSEIVLQTLQKDIEREGELNFLNYEQNLAELEKLIDD